jgi:hypothetical protein
VGIVTGSISGLVVVDVDTSDNGRAEEIANRFPTTLVSRTGSGGTHLFYHHPDPFQTRFPNRVNKQSKTDIRGDGGFVVAPPSMHSNGSLYSWVLHDLSRVPTLPLTALPLIFPGMSNQAEGDKDWILEALQGVGEGERNSTAARLAGYWIHKGIPEDVIIGMLLDWNIKNTPPLRSSEIERTVRSVWETASRETDRKFQDKPSTSLRVREPEPSTTMEDPFSLVPFSEYMATFGGQPINWVIEKWMPDKTIMLMVAPPGAYKTWMLLDLAISVASGTKFLGHYPVLSKGPVIIIQQEDFHGQIAERIGIIVESRFGMVSGYRSSDEDFGLQSAPNLPIYLHAARRFKFSDSVVLTALESHIAAIRPRLVILDPLYSAGETDDYMAKTVTQMFAFKSMRDRYGCSFLMAHHTKKHNDAGGQDRQEAWGSQFLNAFLETGWQIRPGKKTEASTIKIRRHFKVSSNVREETINFNISTEAPYSYRADVTNDGVDLQPEDLKVEAALMEGPTTRADLQKKLPALSVTQLKKTLEKLVELGKVTRGVDFKFKLV